MHKTLFTAIVAAMFAQVSPAWAADQEGYHNDIGDFARIVESRSYRFPYNFGPTGTTGWFYGREFVVNGVDKGSPADGVLRIGERIRAVGGRGFTNMEHDDDNDDPRRIMGAAITECETKEKGGKLVVTVRRNGREQDLVLQLPILGRYAKTWPYDCEKSRRILDEAGRWLIDRQRPDGSFVRDRSDGFALGPSLNGLLLLSTGDPKHLEAARRLAHHFVENPGPDPFKAEETGTDLWGWSYQAIFIAEYYLRTGDAYVLPYLEHLKRIIIASRGPRGGWSHGFKMAAYAVGGYINPNGVSSITALALMEDAGLKIDPEFFEHSKHYFRRWSYGGRGIHYGDHKSPLATEPRRSFGAGKNALATIAFEVMGEQDVSDRFALTVVDTYRHRDGCHAGPFFSLFWGPIAASRCTDEEFRMFLDHWTWFHDLSRRWDGSFLLPSSNGGGGYTARGPVFTMGGQVLLYALPMQKTRVCGAKESPFAEVGMPKSLRPIKALVDGKRYVEAAATLDKLVAAGKLDADAGRRAAMIQDSLATTLKSIDYALAEIENDLREGRSVSARTRIRNLENLLGPGEKSLGVAKQKSQSARHEKIVQAWETFERHSLPAYVDADSYAVVARMADDSEIGFVREKARERLEAIAQWPSYKDSFCSESILAEYMPQWEKDKTAPRPLAAMRLLSFGNGVIWTAWSSRAKLEAEGLLDEFPNSMPLIPTSEKTSVAWRYQTMDEFSPPQDWADAKFDDTAWQTAEAPFLRVNPREKNSEAKWDKKFLVLRRTFDVDEVDFNALRIKGLFQDEADVYVNGRHIARVVNNRRMSKSYIDFDVTVAGLPALKKGRNVLAVKATKGGGQIDIGLLGVKRRPPWQSN